MADVSITAADVVASSGAVKRHGDIAGEEITPCMPYYIHPTTLKAMKAVTTDANTARAVAISLNHALTNQPVSGIVSGDLTTSAVLTASVGYAVSDTAGGIRPLADNGTGDFITSLGVAKSATVLAVDIKPLEVAK